MRPSPYYDRLVDVMEELMKFTFLTRGVSDYLANRSERKKGAEKRDAILTCPAKPSNAAWRRRARLSP
jgi:arsenic resistance protein ArsH